MSSPYLNRFVQPDTIIPSPSNPQSWNRYSYVMNRPVNFNDPTGHDVDCGLAEVGCTKNKDKKTPTPTPTPTPTTGAPLIPVAGVCGSNPDNGPTAPGPNCIQLTKPDDPIIHLEDLDKSAPTGYSVYPVPYTGGNLAKVAQADAIAVNSPRVLICYSAGVDSCLIYAMTTNNSVQAIVLIGGGYYAKYTTDPDETIIGMTSGPNPFDNGFTGAIVSLADKGVHILIIYDGNNAGDPDIPTGGNIQHINVSDTVNHYTVDDPTSGIWTHVWNWIQNPTYQLPYPSAP